MKVCAIIAEYNPFHNGHLAQIKQTKNDVKADAYIVIMSGSFTLRGDLCIDDKETRANWAIDAGVDCVLELPTVYSLSNAEHFAYGALKTLSLVDDLTLSFGSENGNIEILEQTADFLTNENKTFKIEMQNFLKKGYSVAKSRQLALENFNPEFAKIIKTPNNILGIEYIKAAKKLGLATKFYTVKRENNDNKISSTEIRNKIQKNITFQKFVPAFVKSNGIDLNGFQKTVLYEINQKTNIELGKIQNVKEGFENRLKKQRIYSFDDLLNLNSKRYTTSTVKRLSSCATLNLTKDYLELAKINEPYIRILALKNNRKDLLSYFGKRSKNLFLKASDCEASNPIFPLVALDEKAAMLQKLYNL